MPPTTVAANKSLLRRAVSYIGRHVNFFRIHLTVFVFVPLVFGSILYASNGRFHIDYLDCLFIAYSAFAGCGLSTVNLSQLTGWQQAILMFLMLGGHFGVISTVMVLVRKRYFQNRCQHFIRVHGGRKWRDFLKDRLGSRSARRKHQDLPALDLQVGDGDAPKPQSTSNGRHQRLMRGLTTGASPIDKTPPTTLNISLRSGTAKPRALPKDVLLLRNEGHANTPHPYGVPHSPQGGRVHFAEDLVESPNGQQSERGLAYTPAMTTETGQFGQLTNSPLSVQASLPTTPIEGNDPTNVLGNGSRSRPLRYQSLLMPQSSIPSHYHQRGGFPTLSLVTRGTAQAFPQTFAAVQRKLTMPTRPVIVNRRTASTKVDKHEKNTDRNNDAENLVGDLRAKMERWITFDGLKVSRNSNFDLDDLTEEQLEEVGGIEYRALKMLLYLVPAYMFFVHVFCYILIAPALVSTNRYDDVFDSQFRQVPKAWFSLFQVVGAFTGGGMSLSDTSMIPFQSATLMIFSLGFAILAGNHAFPIFLRLVIWILTKFEKDGSPRDQILHFLLDHPRRCFIYLFPCQQTWFLVVILIVFSILEWLAFIVLDIGLPVTESLPAGTRVLAGLFQGLAARASGFSIVNLSALAPAVIFLYIVMMYIAVFPVAMSIRSTNVYEEKSLGVYEKPESEEPQLDGETNDREAVGKYLNWHLRRQLAFDLWWLILGMWLVCIIERDKIMDDDNAPWFNLFRIVFELVSAYGGVGLSLGIPTENYSFIGACRPLSKVVVIFVIVRGRHRGLPMAVDRSILLPVEFSTDFNRAKTDVPVTRAYTLP